MVIHQLKTSCNLSIFLLPVFLEQVGMQSHCFAKRFILKLSSFKMSFVLKKLCFVKLWHALVKSSVRVDCKSCFVFAFTLFSLLLYAEIVFDTWEKENHALIHMWVYSRYSSSLPQSKKRLIGLIGHSKLPVGVIVCVSGCVSLLSL